MKFFAPFLLMLLPMGFPALATTASDVTGKADETVQTAQQYTREQRDAFIHQMDENLDAVKTKIREMKTQTGASKDEAIAKLESQQRDLEKRLKVMRHSSAEAWDQLQTGVSKAWTTLKASLDSETGTSSKP